MAKVAPSRDHPGQRRIRELALRRQPVASKWEVRAQHELAFETARLDTAVCVGDLVEGISRSVTSRSAWKMASQGTLTTTAVAVENNAILESTGTDDLCSRRVG
ncbi:hypothetical protein LuPra_01110 [Luteitalea pratensis]|uniref:Uncharacterized protein n=1 Tax=Luteitalea pratensis TaxID=1855912 RepID=A0A143PHM9_LUTPR|nr:hypothetical protein LuPra_01110 [Luteitalea pratensis]